MKKTGLFLIIAVIQFLTVSLLNAKTIEDSRIKMLNGEYAKILDYNNDGPMIINFWTTWWPFCERQLAYLDQLNESFENAGLQVLTVNVNKPNILNQVRPFMNKRKYKFPVSVDPRSKLAKKFGQNSSHKFINAILDKAIKSNWITLLWCCNHLVQWK